MGTCFSFVRWYFDKPKIPEGGSMAVPNEVFREVVEPNKKKVCLRLLRNYIV